jgi:hypothetical protein
MLSVLGFLKRKDFPKEELCVSIVSEYDEKWWMVGELM